MTKAILLALGTLAFALLILAAWRWADKRADNGVWAMLTLHQPLSPGVFDPAMLEGLPEPARRYFRFAIKPGTPLYTVAEISMEGDFSVGSKAEPNYMPMRAEQILAAPHGFVWKLNAGDGMMRVSGSDVAENNNSWSRFWLLGIAPVARAGGNKDHVRSAFGRYVAEALFWTPAAVLPGDHVRWDPVTATTARVTVTYRGLEQAVDLTVGTDGRPTKVLFQRWSNANPNKTFQLQPFGGYVSEFKDFNGFRLPTRVEAGNFFGTDDYFPFFRVNVTSVRFPRSNEK
jgi:hypothetical protein